MIAKELQFRSKHYAWLVGVMSVMFAIYLFGTDVLLRTVICVLIGIVYIGWGLWSHRSEIQTPRLVLEYVAVGTLGAVILGVLAHTI